MGKIDIMSQRDDDEIRWTVCVPTAIADAVKMSNEQIQELVDWRRLGGVLGSYYGIGVFLAACLKYEEEHSKEKTNGWRLH